MVAAIQPVRHRMSVTEYLAFCATNPARYERYELINGEIYEPVAESIAHADMVEAVADALRRRYAGQRVYSNGSVRLDGDGMPLPDIYVVAAGAEPEGDYWNGRQLDLVVEVANSTWTFDINEKLRNYATGGVPHYYVVTLDETPIVDCFAHPSDGGYRSSTVNNIEYLLGNGA